MRRDTIFADTGSTGIDHFERRGKPLPRISKDVFALVLAGGRGSRLLQLTNWRAKPAVPFGGKFRIIDFALSNCVNSGMCSIGVATQYKAQSLIRHLHRGWSFLNGRFGEFVELLPAQQRIHDGWYSGTADAVLQNLDILQEHSPEHVLVLSGDHVYKMDYRVMLEEHIERDADLSIACVEIAADKAQPFGVIEIEGESRVAAFQEKPDAPATIPGRPGRSLVSMGIYVFRADLLYKQVIRDSKDADSTNDFGKDIIPHMIQSGCRVFAHGFSQSCVNMANGAPYWRDVGTVDAYWEANMELARVTPALDLYDEAWPIWTYQEQLPPAKFVFDDEDRHGVALNSLVSGGCILSGCTVRRSVLFSGVRVHEHSLIEDSVVLPEAVVGNDVVLKRAVVDKRCRIPSGLRVGLDPDQDRKRFPITPGGIALVHAEALGQ